MAPKDNTYGYGYNPSSHPYGQSQQSSQPSGPGSGAQPPSSFQRPSNPNQYSQATQYNQGFPLTQPTAYSNQPYAQGGYLGHSLGGLPAGPGQYTSSGQQGYNPGPSTPNVIPSGSTYPFYRSGGQQTQMSTPNYSGGQRYPPAPSSQVPTYLRQNLPQRGPLEKLQASLESTDISLSDDNLHALGQLSEARSLIEGAIRSYNDLAAFKANNPNCNVKVLNSSVSLVDC